VVGTLDLVFERRCGRTVLAHAHATAPLRVGPTFAIDDAAYLILVCTGPGIFGGDTLRQSVHVRSGARVVLVSQSSLQVHPSPADAPATIEHRYGVESGGELHCHWDPVIPFAGARLDQQFAIEADRDARLYWSDAIMSGRASRGEAWQFRELAHRLDLRVNGTLAYLERYRVAPAERRVTRPWIAGGAHYLATTLVQHDGITRDHVESLQRTLSGDESVTAGVDLLDDRLLASRFAGSSGVAFSAARRAARAFACASIFASPDLAVRK
jgi:urease accessory protein